MGVIYQPDEDQLEPRTAQEREDAAFETQEVQQLLEYINNLAILMDNCMKELDSIIPPPAGCVSGLTKDNRHGWFIKANLDVPVLHSVARVKP